MRNLKIAAGLLALIATLVVTGAARWLGQSSPPYELIGNNAVTATVVRVVDGDTIDVVFASTTDPVRVRYIGVDTPELYQGQDPECGSSEASAYNSALVMGRVVELVSDQDDTDRYGRLLRYVYVDDIMVNEQLVRDGYATTMTIRPNVTHADRFMALARQAMTDKVGIWQDCPITELK
jgi:micrococcal nuclease